MTEEQALQEPEFKPDTADDFRGIIKSRRTHIFNRLVATKPLSELVDLLGYEIEDDEDEESAKPRGQLRASTIVAQTGFAIRLGIKAENGTHIALVDCAIEWTWKGTVGYTAEALTDFVVAEASADAMTTAKTLLTETASGIRVVLDGIFSIPQTDLATMIVTQLAEQHGLVTETT